MRLPSVSNLAMSSSSSSSCSSLQHGNLIESDSRYLCHPKWQAPLGYLLYLFILLIYTIGEKIVLVAHQLYKDLYRSEGVEIAFMTEEYEEDVIPKSPKRQTTVNSLLARSLRILRFIVDSGASRHMANVTPDILENFSYHSDTDIVRIRTAGKTVIQSIGEGDFGPMQQVLSVPELSANLFSVRSCCANGYKLIPMESRGF
jgi:hypothetical protein